MKLVKTPSILHLKKLPEPPPELLPVTVTLNVHPLEPGVKAKVPDDVGVPDAVSVTVCAPVVVKVPVPVNVIPLTKLVEML